MLTDVYVLGGAWLASDEVPAPMVPEVFVHPATGDRVLICDECEERPARWEPYAGTWCEAVPGEVWVSDVCERDDHGRPWWETMRRVTV